VTRTHVLGGLAFLAVFAAGVAVGRALFSRPAAPGQPAGRADEKAPPPAELTPGFVATLPPRWREKYPAIYSAGMKRLGISPAALRDKAPHDLAAHANESTPGLGFLRPSFVYGAAARELADRLPRPWGAINSAYLLTGLVANGGFHGFFADTGGVYNTRLLDDLDFLGAAEHRAVVAEALDLYADHGAGGSDVYAAPGARWRKLPSLLGAAGTVVRQNPTGGRGPGSAEG
jgi:hypothetical protein